MKKIWGKYSYTVILIVTSFLLITVIANGLNSNHNEGYIVVKVNEGDSLWKLAEELSDKHHLTKREFVSWVEKENGIINGKIYTGEEIIVPVVSESIELPTQTASIEIE